MENNLNTYANKFMIIANDTGREFILNLYQNSPVVDNDFNFTGVNSAPIGSFVMNRELATQLRDHLTDLLSKNNTENNNG